MSNRIGQAPPKITSTPTTQSVEKANAQVLGGPLGDLKLDQSGAQKLNATLQGQVGFNGAQLGQTFGQEGMKEVIELLSQSTITNEGDGGSGGGDGVLE